MKTIKTILEQLNFDVEVMKTEQMKEHIHRCRENHKNDKVWDIVLEVTGVGLWAGILILVGYILIR